MQECSMVEPNLLNVYINDTAVSITFCQLQLFADDLKSTTELHNTVFEMLIQDDLD